jgi:hypothetical protein
LEGLEISSKEVRLGLGEYFGEGEGVLIVSDSLGVKHWNYNFSNLAFHYHLNLFTQQKKSPLSTPTHTLETLSTHPTSSTNHLKYSGQGG